MRLITGCNEPYLQRMRGYLTSLNSRVDFPVSFVTVGFEWGSPFEGIASVKLPKELNAGAPPETEAIQHGSFLQVVEPKPREVLLCTDGDMVMQRAMDDEEKEMLKLKKGQVVTSWNGGPHETLALEATRLYPKMPLDRIKDDWGHFDKPIYNVGFLAATKETWEDIYNEYMIRWERVGDFFGHMARQQWLISYVIANQELDVIIAPWSFHAHGHFGPKPGMVRGGDGLIYADGKLACFRHYL